MTDSERFCAYCLKAECRCEYRPSKMGSVAHTISNTMAQSTFGEMQQQIAESFASLNPETKGMWSVSFTRLDEKNLTKRLQRVKHLRGTDESNSAGS